MSMHDAPRGGPRPDCDGIHSQAKSGAATRVYLLVAVLVIVAAAAYLLLQGTGKRSEGAPGVAGAERTVASSMTDAGVRARNAANTPSERAQANGAAAGVDGEDPTADLSDVLPAGSAPSMAEVIDGLHEAGIQGGLAAFPKPGTSPPLVGLAVPQDYPLPPGYVRHYQATDDGQRIEPILMFAPDARFVDVAGQPVPLPPDRVVPPSMAPPGLPVRLIRIPPPRPGAGR